MRRARRRVLLQSFSGRGGDFCPQAIELPRKEEPAKSLRGFRAPALCGPLRSLSSLPFTPFPPVHLRGAKKKTRNKAMRDRTQELREKDDESDNEDVERVALVTQHGLAKHSNFPDPTDGFFQMTRDIREALKVLECKVKDLEKNQTTVMASPIPDDNTKQGLQKLREEIKELAKDIRAQLKRIEPTKEEQDENRNSFNNRMKRNQHGILSQQFMDLINKCNSVQSDYRDRNLERIKRHLQITGSTVVSDDKLDEMLESGQTEVFISNLMKDTQVTKQALNEIETRHSEILKLERSIQELHDLFMFLATEVELQV